MGAPVTFIPAAKDAAKLDHGKNRAGLSAEGKADSKKAGKGQQRQALSMSKLKCRPGGKHKARQKAKRLGT